VGKKTLCPPYQLAADFAAIYLNHSIQASPCESVWLDEEGLMRQQPMFKVNAIKLRINSFSFNRIFAWSAYIFWCRKKT